MAKRFRKIDTQNLRRSLRSRPFFDINAFCHHPDRGTMKFALSQHGGNIRSSHATWLRFIESTPPSRRFYRVVTAAEANVVPAGESRVSSRTKAIAPRVISLTNARKAGRCLSVKVY